MSTQKKSDRFANIQAQVQASIDQQAEERKRELFKKRLEIAREGMVAHENEDMNEALKFYMTYLRILEDNKKVTMNGLMPIHFQDKKEMPELLLISSIYWSIARIYDAVKRTKKRPELITALDKFVIFSKGTPFQAMNAEMLRKYCPRAIHSGDFVNAYKKFGLKQCFIATELEAELAPGVLETLQKFRDERLLPVKTGAWLVERYYHAGPRVAVRLARAPRWFRKGCGVALSGLGVFISKACRFESGEK